MNENDTRHSIKPVQRRLLIPLALVLLLLIGGFAAAMLSLQKYYLDKEIQEEVEAASNQLQQNLKREASLLAFIEEAILADRRLHDALKSSNRKRLQANDYVLFSRIREKHGITHRQQADIIDRTHDAVGILDFDGYISSWNRGAERMFGIGATGCTSMPTATRS